MKQLALLALALFSSAIVLAANPYTTPPGGSATGVPSSSQTGLVPNKSNSGNNTVFLRDSSGRTFRGVVPYGSSFYYDRSAGGTLQRFSSSPTSSSVAGATSYYDPRTGVRVDLSKLSSGGSNSMVNPYAPPNLPQLANTQFGPLPRPISSRPGDLTRELDRRINPYLTQDAANSQTDINALAKQARQNKNVQVDPDLLLPKTPDSEINTNFKQDRVEPQPSSSLYDQIKNQTLEDVRREEADALKKKAQEDAAAAKSQAIEIPEYKSIFKSDSESKADPDRSSSKIAERTSIRNPLEAKVLDYFAAAEEYLNQGRFYKAADTYALAALWQPDNVLAYVGQSWSLFGAGEYMSSAYYLDRAIAMDPKMAEKKISIGTFLRDRDIFENRLIEMTHCQQQSNSGEMAFLLAYILWQDGKAVQAQGMIQSALDLMPDRAAVQLLSKAINIPQTPSLQAAPSDPNQAVQ